MRDGQQLSFRVLGGSEALCYSPKKQENSESLCRSVTLDINPVGTDPGIKVAAMCPPSTDPLFFMLGYRRESLLIN